MRRQLERLHYPGRQLKLTVSPLDPTAPTVWLPLLSATHKDAVSAAELADGWHVRVEHTGCACSR